MVWSGVRAKGRGPEPDASANADADARAGAGAGAGARGKGKGQGQGYRAGGKVEGGGRAHSGTSCAARRLAGEKIFVSGEI